MVSGDANLLIKILSKSSHILTVDNQLKVTNKNIVKTAVVLRPSTKPNPVPPEIIHPWHGSPIDGTHGHSLALSFGALALGTNVGR